MKRGLFILSVSLSVIILSGNLNAQNSNILKGAEKSYNAATSAFKKKNYEEASGSFIVAVDNISRNIDSRKYQLIRLDAASKLVDIHFNHEEDLTKACKYLDIFVNDLNRMKKDDNLKAKDIYKYLELEKEYAIYKRKCDGFNSIDSKKKEFEKKFDEAFDDE